MLHRHRAHQEALARIAFLVEEQAIGVLTGEVGSGKTVAARAAVAAREPSRYSVICPANPAIGIRGLYAEIDSRLGGEPRFFKSAHRPGGRALGERGQRARTTGRGDR